MNVRVPSVCLAWAVAGLVAVAGCSYKPEDKPQTPAKESVVHATIEPPVQQEPTAVSPPPAPDITVTTRRLEEKLQEVPLAITAFDSASTAAASQSAPAVSVPYYSEDRENYEHFDENPVKLAREQPVSTFSIDVDTGSYSNVRRFLNGGTLPPQDAVRVEELVNYFPYAYPPPVTGDRPFAVSTALAPAPWNPDKLLLRIGIKGYEIPAAKRAPANLVFLIDVSGSMQPADKLPLLKRSLALLARQLRASDRVSMVVYAGAAGAVLLPTPGDHRAEIVAALDRLEAGGSTNGADGIRLAYDFARQSYIKGGVNRVLLATDGDFNVGTVSFEALIDLVERERDGGIALTTLGFGEGNYNDKLLERLADAGNGNYAYVDTLNEGRKVLVGQVTGTLQTIAKDVKIQVEFNPAAVAEYRLVGYENRQLRREDFNNDRIDAGEIGAGHSVTALYEIVPAGSRAALVDPLRYGDGNPAAPARAGELAWVRLRYKASDGDHSHLIEQAVRRADATTLAAASPELRFAAAVAAFGQLLRGGQYTGDYSYTRVAELAAGARGDDPDGYRGEFLSLVKLADSLSEHAQPVAAESGPDD